MHTSEKAARAGALLFTRKIWAGVLNLFVISYLTRVLNKEDFGLYVIAGLLISIIETLGPISIGDYLIYKKTNGKDELVNSAFWLNFVLVLVIVMIMYAGAQYWAAYYNNVKIKYLVHILCFGFLGNIFYVIPSALLKKRLDFKPLIIIQTITGTLSQLSTLGLAIWGLGVYSLALPSAIFPVIVGIYIFIKAKPAIKFNLGVSYWKQIMAYTKFIIGNKILGRFSSDGDSLIIGKVLGLTSLGVYNIANRFPNLLNQNLMPILEDVSFPIFSKNNTNKEVLRKQFLYVTRIISMILVPVYFILMLFAPVIITTLFGDKWEDAVLPLRILSVFSLIECISYSTSVLYNAMGKPNIKFRFTLIFTPVFLILVWIFAPDGLITACIVVTVLKILNFGYHIYKVGSIIHLSLIKFVNEIKHVVIPNLLLGGIYLFFLHYLHNVNIKYLMIITYAPIVYFIAFFFFRKNILKDYLLICKLFPALKLH
jgi:O-antigen/teichoic acid export membrane protein